MNPTNTTPNGEDAQYAQLPGHATERLVEMRGKNESQRLFTSDLSTSEFLLVKEAGFDPVGLVVGSSIYHVGFQQSAFMQNQEMTVFPRRCTAPASWRWTAWRKKPTSSARTALSAFGWK